MFYSSAEIDEDLKCAFCKQEFIGVVKLVPDCGESICDDCYQTLLSGLDDSGRFECQVCKRGHEMPESGLPDCRALSRMLKRRKVERPLSEQASALKRRVEALPSQLLRLKSFDEREHVDHHCDLLELEVIVEFESLVKHVDEIERDLLKQISDYREESLDLLAARPGSTTNQRDGITQELNALTRDLEEFTAQWTGYFNRADSFVSDSNVGAALESVQRFEKRIQSLESVFRNNSLDGRAMSFEVKHQDFSQLRKSFNLPIQPTNISILPTPSRTLTGHSNSVCDVIFLPDGRLASCSHDKTIKIWSGADGAMLFELKGHARRVSSLALLPNGWLASCSLDKTIKIWDLEQRREVRTLQPLGRSKSSLRVMKNGNLASFSQDESVKVWNPCVEGNDPLLVIQGGQKLDRNLPVGVLANNYLVTCSSAKDSTQTLLRVWNPINGRKVKTVSTDLSKALSALVLSNDQIALGFENGTIKVVDLTNQALTRSRVKAHEKYVTALAQLSNGNLLSAGRVNATPPIRRAIKLWALRDLSLLQTIPSYHSNVISSLAISSDEKQLVSASHDGAINLWRVFS